MTGHSYIHIHKLLYHIITYAHMYVCMYVYTYVLYNANCLWWKTFIVACSSCYSQEKFCDCWPVQFTEKSGTYVATYHIGNWNINGRIRFPYLLR